MNHEQRITGRIFVVDDHDAARESIALVLRHAGHEVRCFPGAASALADLEQSEPDVIVTDLQMPGMSGLELMRELSRRNCEAQVVMVTAYASVATAVEAMRNGAFDYLEKPFELEQLERLVERALLQRERGGLRSSIPDSECETSRLIGSSLKMRELRAAISQVAQVSETVLIVGESGTGKELVARAIHAKSVRNARAFVGVNCPALSPQLMESELFGHEKGAFTSADAPRIGRFELADGGTILLDEVTEIELPLQAKLLRVLQERAFERVGSSVTRSVDARVISATNRDLASEVAARRFRDDLYFRLNVLPISVPPLRERKEDLPELTRHFLQTAAARLARSPLESTAEADALLAAHDWPGNVRELENLMTRAAVLARGPRLTAADLAPWLGSKGTLISAPAASVAFVSEESDLRLEDMERKLIESTLERFEGHREKTAKALGIGIRTLSNKLRQYGYGPRTRVFAKAG